ncbi:MAG: metal-sensitive transcriptional regulator [Candidatus Binataceae bacterium]
MRRTSVLERDLLSRLLRAEGQLRGIQSMIKRNAYCIDVLQQVSAVRRALDRFALLLIRDHLETCVSDAMAHRNADERIRELVNAIDRFLG